MDVISFKSIPEYWEKERSGLKPNTVRRLDDDDARVDAVEDYYRGKTKLLYVEVVNTGTREKFLRRVTDISIWEGLIIISWNPNHIIETKDAESCDICSGIFKKRCNH